MGIRERGSRYFVDVSVYGRRRTATCRTYDEAVCKQAALRDKLFRKRTIPPTSEPVSATVPVARLAVHQKSWTLQQALEKTKQAAWSDMLNGDRAVLNAQVALNYFGASTRLDELTTDRLDDYAAYLAGEGNSNATINRKLAALSKLLTVAVERGGMEKRPIIRRKPEGVGRIRYLSEGEEAKVLQIFRQWGKDDHVDVFMVLIDSGLRESELWRMEARDIDFTQGIMTVWKTKNGQPRSVPMTERVREIIECRSEAAPVGSLFPYRNEWFGHVWDRMREVLKLSEDRQFVPYALRHTCCSRLVQRGVNLRVVQEWMGHKTITVTLRYAHLCPTNLLNAVRVLNRG